MIPNLLTIHSGLTFCYLHLVYYGTYASQLQELVILSS
jgi:hypothetical protein